jgi:hypothetical protein
MEFDEALAPFSQQFDREQSHLCLDLTFDFLDCAGSAGGPLFGTRTHPVNLAHQFATKRRDFRVAFGKSQFSRPRCGITPNRIGHKGNRRQD